MEITSLYPVLMVDDVATAARFYREELGFETTFEADWYVSLRSDGSVDVNELAGRFGGGGHKVAAGLRVRGDLEKVRKELFAALDQAMNGGSAPPRG